MSVAVDFRITQVVDGNWGVHAIIKKAFSPAGSVLRSPHPALSPKGRGIQQSRTFITLSPIGGEGRVRGQASARCQLL
jgi:hypothetical protein